MTGRGRLRLTVLLRMIGACTICMAMSGSGAMIGMEINIMTIAMRKVLLRILLGLKPVRTVCFVAGAGATLPSAVGRRIAAAAPPATGAAALASAWCSSRSQLAAHSGFAFERE